MDYTFDNWKQEEVVASDTQIPDLKTLAVKDGKELTVKVALKDPVTLWVRNDMDKSQVTITPELNKNTKDKELTAPVEKHTEIGTATVALTEDTLGYLEKSDAAAATSAIRTTKNVEKANFFVIAGRNIKGFFQGASQLELSLIKPHRCNTDKLSGCTTLASSSKCSLANCHNGGTQEEPSAANPSPNFPITVNAG